VTATASAKPDGPVEDSTPPSDAQPAVPRASAWWILSAGVIGLIASATLTIEKIELLLNPAYVPSCNLNPIVSCGSVMTTPHWLIYQSLYQIGALCPYCMVVWVATISLLVVVASIVFGPTGEHRGGVVVRELYHWRWSIAAIWFTAVFLLIVARFWAYWSTLI
jgi:uncharacterized membrane protein